MSEKYLQGIQIPITIDALRQSIGQRVCFLPERDIDKSGRGYYFPRYGTIEEVGKKNVRIGGDYFNFSDLREIALIHLPAPQSDNNTEAAHDKES